MKILCIFILAISVGCAAQSTVSEDVRFRTFESLSTLNTSYEEADKMKQVLFHVEKNLFSEDEKVTIEKMISALEIYISFQTNLSLDADVKVEEKDDVKIKNPMYYPMD